MDNPQPGPSMFRNTNIDEEGEDLMLGYSQRKRRKIVMYDSDGNEHNSKDNVNSDGIEDIDTTSEDMYSESETSVVSENDDLNQSIRNDGNDDEWTCDGNFKELLFKGGTGLKCSPDASDPYDFFKLLLDDNFFLNIITETNKYGNGKEGDHWKKLTVEEFKIFLGLLLHMGTIKCPRFDNYWDIQRLFDFTCFSRHMSRNRFQEIINYLRFFSSNTNNDCLNKIQPIIDYFNKKMKLVYYPEKELSINKSMAPWEGRLELLQFIGRKKHKYAVELYVLTENSGITLRIKAHKNHSDDISGKGHGMEPVLDLLEDFLQKGHSVYMDKFCSSYKLTKQLLDAKTYCTATLKKFRKGNNINVIKAKVTKGEIISSHKNNIMMGKFRDNSDVFFVSSEFKADLIKFESKTRGNHKKPLVLHKYNQIMNNIKKRDQMLSYYTCLRKTFKWYIKLWIHIVETLLLNSFFLYSKYSSSTEKIHFFDFRLNIIDVLLFENSVEDIPFIFSQHKHLPEMLSRDENNKVKRKRCRECFAKGIRKNTNYFCSGCKDHPGLCLGACFKEFHEDQKMFVT